MICHRIVELQAKTVIQEITNTQAEYEFLENLIDEKKPPYLYHEYHYLIATPFRYQLPVKPQYASRFKAPGFMRNCFYGCLNYSTTVFEYSYHWLRQRVHLTHLSQEVQLRTHFTVDFYDSQLKDIRKHKQIKKIMDRHDYTASHEFIRRNKKVDSLLYPSARDGKGGDCVVTFEIKTLGKRSSKSKKPKSEKTLHFIYNNLEKSALVESVIDQKKMEVKWKDVS